MERIAYEASTTRREPKLPGIVLAAGIIWIIIGAPIVLFMLIPLLLAVLFGQLGGAGGALILITGLIAAFGAVFITVGVKTIRGTAADTLGNGIGSIIFGLLMGGLSLDLQHGGAGLALIVAGVLALVGRAGYLAWQASRDRPRRAFNTAGRTGRSR